MSQEIADGFVEALRQLEEDRDVEALVGIHAEDCEVGNVSVPETFRGHEGLREFWTEYRKTFDEMKYTFRNVFATEDGAALEWTTEGTSNGDTVSYDGVSIPRSKAARSAASWPTSTPGTSPSKSWTDSAKLAARPDGPTYSRVLRNRGLLLDTCPLV